MSTPIEGRLDARGMKMALVVSRFHDTLTSQLLHGAADCLVRHGLTEEELAVHWVPGTFEIPLVAQQLANSGKHDAVICLGVLVRGETAHFDLIASEVSRGVAQAGLAAGVPVAFGIVTAESFDQAAARSGGKMGNRGFDAAQTAIEMVDLLRQL
jgi:6,7-dimethyl-8-ribityllumazine synthase